MPHGDITHLDIPVSDFEQAKSFYGALFGWTIQAPPGFEGYPMWMAPNQVSGGGLVDRNQGLPAPRSYVEVDSIDETLSTATSHGATVVLGKSEISPTSWMAVLADPDGNEIGLYQGVTEVKA